MELDLLAQLQMGARQGSNVLRGRSPGVLDRSLSGSILLWGALQQRAIRCSIASSRDCCRCSDDAYAAISEPSLLRRRNSGIPKPAVTGRTATANPRRRLLKTTAPMICSGPNAEVAGCTAESSIRS